MKYLKHENKFLYLLIAMGLMIGFIPSFAMPGGKDWVIQLIYLLMLIGALYVMKKRRRSIVTAVIIATGGFVLNTSGLIAGIKPISISGDILYLVFYAMFIMGVLTDILKAPNVTKDSFYGAICVYFMIAIFYATIYNTLEYANPGSFSNVGKMVYANGDPAFFNLLYFSFITLATVGYGDITPLSPAGKSFAVLESTTGVFYIAILVSHLIGHSKNNFKD